MEDEHRRPCEPRGCAAFLHGCTGGKAVAHEARELPQRVIFLPTIVSSGIDLLLIPASARRARQGRQAQASGQSRKTSRRKYKALWVSNSLSGRGWQLDEASTVRHPAHLIRIGRSQR